MPIRFRRTFKIFPGVKINVSKGGISVTVGTRGANLNFSKRGVRQTVGLPGSGLSETSYLVKNEPESEKDEDKEKKSESASREQDDQELGCFPWGCLLFIIVIGVVGYFVANAYHLLPPNYLSNLLLELTKWLKSFGF